MFSIDLEDPSLDALFGIQPTAERSLEKQPPATPPASQEPAAPPKPPPPPDLLEDDQPGAFMSFLQWIDRPFQIVGNLVQGRWESAAKQGVDILGDAVDAFLPYDLIPAATDKKDYTSGSEILEIDENAPWWKKLAADVGLGVALDPLTYLTLGTSAIAKSAAKTGTKVGATLVGKTAFGAKRALKQASTIAAATREAGEVLLKKGLAGGDDLIKYANKLAPSADDFATVADAMTKSAARLRIPFTPIGLDLPVTYGQVEKILSKGGEAVRKIPLGKEVQEFGTAAMRLLRGGLGGFRHSDMFDNMLAKSGGQAAKVTRLETEWLRKTLGGVKVGSKMDEAIGAVMNRVLQDGDQIMSLERIADPIATVAAKYGVDAKELTKHTGSIAEFMPKQWDNLVRAGAVSGEGVRDYFPRILHGAGDVVMDPFAIDTVYTGIPKRVLENTDELVEYLVKNRQVTLEPSAIKALAGRIGGQGRLVQKAELVRDIIGPGAGQMVNNPAVREGMSSIIDSLLKQDPDVGSVLKSIFKGGNKAGGAMRLLALNNKIFKPAATHGVLLPRLAFHIRNKLSSIVQAAATPGASVGQAVKTVPGDIAGLLADGLQHLGTGTGRIAGLLADGLKHIGIGTGRKGHLGKALTVLDDAFIKAGGSTGRLDEILNASGKVGKQLREAVDHGVMEGYVSTEGLLKAWNKVESGPGGFAWNWLTMGGEMTQGLESRMRLGMFLDLRSSGKSAKQAAKITRDALLDYGLTRGNPELYGTMRHLIPFLAFTAQSIPQQAKWMMRNPGVAVGLAQLYGNRSKSPILPWVAEGLHIPVGNDEEGNPQHLTTLGMPFEVLQSVPNLSADPRTIGRDLRRDVLGAAHPIIKAMAGYTFNVDPFFGTKYGSYAKMPYVLQAMGLPENHEYARMYREFAQTGIAQPVVSAESVVSQFFDPRTSPLEKALRFTTGARIVSSDPERATKQILEQKLKNLPQVGTIEIPYLARWAGDDPLAAALLDAHRKAQ